MEFYSLALILGGAIGNLGERGYNLITFNDGKVTDFIELLFIPSFNFADSYITCLLYTSPSPRDRTRSRMPSSA